MNLKPTTKIVTFIIIPALIVGILVYDSIAVATGGSEASISSLIIKMSYEMPFAVFMTGNFLGILEGHLFWRMRGNKDTKEIDKHE